MKHAVPARQAARIYDLVAHNWRETTELLNKVNGTHFTADGVQSAVRRYHNEHLHIGEKATARRET